MNIYSNRRQTQRGRRTKAAAPLCRGAKGHPFLWQMSILFFVAIFFIYVCPLPPWLLSEKNCSHEMATRSTYIFVKKGKGNLFRPAHKYNVPPRVLLSLHCEHDSPKTRRTLQAERFGIRRKTSFLWICLRGPKLIHQSVLVERVANLWRPHKFSEAESCLD